MCCEPSTRLTSLDLSHTGFDDDAVVVLIEALIFQPSLHSLTLKGNILTAHGAGLLAKAINRGNGGSIKNLSLGGNLWVGNAGEEDQPQQLVMCSVNFALAISESSEHQGTVSFISTDLRLSCSVSL